jgi:DnaK suppressor protein
MKTPEKKKYKKLLLNYRSQLMKDLAKTNENFIGQSVKEGDLVDIASDFWNRTINMGISNTELQELKEVEHALQKIETSVYGVCEECKKDIKVKRLEALPAARRCLNCQTIFDKSKK